MGNFLDVSAFKQGYPSRKVGLIRTLLDCHQYCGILCVAKLIAQSLVLHIIRIIKHLFTPSLARSKY